MKGFIVLLLSTIFISCGRKPVERTTYFPKQMSQTAVVPEKKNVWVFLLAGQSNMAGRGLVEPADTLPLKRLLTINRQGELTLAKEPLHFYEPALTGLDCGYSFGKTLLKNLPDSVFVLLIPTAIGGSSISQWLGDSLYRNVKLFSNFKQKVETGKQFGIIKALLWHQGESDANKAAIPYYKGRLGELLGRFRAVIGDDNLPVLLGELGSYSKNNDDWQAINKAIHAYSAADNRTAVIATGDFKHKGDSIHFNSEGQRMMGERFAKAYVSKFMQGSR